MLTIQNYNKCVEYAKLQQVPEIQKYDKCSWYKTTISAYITKQQKVLVIPNYNNLHKT